MINIIIAGVGGKGELLIAKIISEVAAKIGLDVKSYTTSGINIRNGKSYANIRISEKGEKLYSHKILVGDADILLGLEPLEAYRLSYYLKEKALVVLSNYRIYPMESIVGEKYYPINIPEALSEKYNVVEFDIKEISKMCIKNTIYENTKIDINNEFVPRNILVANFFIIGTLAKYMIGLIPKELWLEVIRENIIAAIKDENIRAFNLAYSEVIF